MSHTIRIYNKLCLKKTRRIDVRTWEIPFDERKSTDHSGFEYHPYKQLKMHCSEKCSYCYPRIRFHGAQRAARRSHKILIIMKIIFDKPIQILETDKLVLKIVYSEDDKINIEANTESRFNPLM